MANDMTGKVKRMCFACHNRTFWVYEGSDCYRCLSCRRTDALRRGCDLPEFTPEGKDLERHHHYMQVRELVGKINAVEAELARIRSQGEAPQAPDALREAPKCIEINLNNAQIRVIGGPELRFAVAKVLRDAADTVEREEAAGRWPI